MSTTADIAYDDDADLVPIQHRNVAVLGYDELARAHALCLRDSGVDVRVGLPADEAGRGEAEGDGLRVVSPYEACEESDLIAMLGPVQDHPELFATAVAPNVVAGDALVVGQGFGLRYDVFRPPADLDVIMVTSLEAGDRVRSEYDEGRGVPALVAVDQDATGQAWPLALSYARALGATRAGVIRTTVAEEAESALFASTVVAGAMAALLRASYDALVDAGCRPEVAYLRVRRAVQGVAGEVVGGQGPVDSALRAYGEGLAAGGIVDASTHARLAELWGPVRDGSLAADVAEQWFRTEPAATADDGPAPDPFAAAGGTVRAMMGWLRAGAAGRSEGR